MKLRFLHRAYKARYRDQRAELRALVEALSPGDVAVDVGANKGSYLLWLSRAVVDGRVVAFEPQPGLADYLTRACAAAGLRNVTVEACGVSNAEGTRTLFVPGSSDSPSATFESVSPGSESVRSVTVPVVTLDRYLARETRRVRAIKIDVEGHELSVLRGATEVLREHRPRLVMECESRHLAGADVATVLEFLRSLAYDGHFVHRARLVPISEFRSEVHQRPVGAEYWKSRDYCNNFVLSSRLRA